MHKIITGLVAGAFIIGVGVGRSFTMAAPQTERFEGINPTKLMQQIRDLRDETVKDAV